MVVHELVFVLVFVGPLHKTTNCLANERKRRDATHKRDRNTFKHATVSHVRSFLYLEDCMILFSGDIVNCRDSYSANLFAVSN